MLSSWRARVVTSSVFHFGLYGAITSCGGVAESGKDTTNSFGGASAGTAGQGGGGTSANCAPVSGGRWHEQWDGAVGRCPSECARLADEILTELEPGYCTAVIRFDATTLVHKGHAFVCTGAGDWNSTEAGARAAAAQFTGFSPYADPGSDGTLISNDPVWIFYESPSDFGGVIAVSAATGLVTFAASYEWNEAGKILSPTEWSQADIGIDCRRASDAPVASAVVPAGHGFEDPVAGELVRRSVFPELWNVLGGGVSGSSILIHLPNESVPGAGTKDAEYVVFINGYTAGG